MEHTALGKKMCITLVSSVLFPVMRRAPDPSGQDHNTLGQGPRRPSLLSSLSQSLRYLANRLNHGDLYELEDRVLRAAFIQNYKAVRELAPQLIEQATFVLGDSDTTTLLGHFHLGVSYLKHIPTDRLKAIEHFEQAQTRAEARLETEQGTLDTTTTDILGQIARFSKIQLEQVQ